MNISPRQLRMFLALSESLNFSKTAEQLFITQPSLSKTIRDLEDALGVTLFERTTRSVQLTDSGRQLATLARTVIGEYDAGLKRMQSSAEREAQQLRIASLPSLANVMLPQICANLEARHNSPRITINDCSNSASIERVLNYQVDFALASVAPSHPELQYEEILRDRFVVLSCGVWRKRIGDDVRLDELLELPVISMTDARTAMRYISAAFLQRGVEFRPKLQLDQVGTIAGFLKEGIGVAVLPYLGMMPMVSLKGMKISSISDGPLRSVGVVTRRQGNLSAMAQSAVHEIRTVAAQLMGAHPDWLLSARK